MAAPTTTPFGKFKIQLGNGATPEVFTAPCGFTQKSLQLSKNLTEVNLPDCDDPDKVTWVARDAQTFSAQVSGEGVLASSSVDAWLTAFESGNSINVKVIIEFPAKTITWTGKMHISSFSPTAEQGGRVTASIEMQSDGELTRVTT